MPDYRVHNLTIRSDFAIDAIAEADAPLPGDAIAIAAGMVPTTFDQPEKARRHYQSDPGKVLLHARGVGRMLVRDGRTITYERAPGCADALLAAHVLGSGLAAIHHQRGNVVLHAASLCRDGQAFLLCGKSGAGKSTTAAHLLANGGETLGDDVAAIGDGPEYLVHPGPASTRLTDAALAHLPGLAAYPGEQRCATGKRIIPTSARFLGNPMPLAGIIVLEPGTTGEVTAEQLNWHEAFAAVRLHTFRKRFITRAMRPLLMQKWGALSQSVPIWRISRPAGRDTLRQVVTQAEYAIIAMANREQDGDHATGH